MDMYIQAAGTWQAVWIISLSRIQLYNELNLFCAALRACNTHSKDKWVPWTMFIMPELNYPC